jgi:copper chaperone CopZ
MEKQYKILGMTCSGCQKKISEKLNSLENIKADINLENNTATIISDKEFEINTLNKALEEIGNYKLEDPDNPEKPSLNHRTEFLRLRFTIAQWNAKEKKFIFSRAKDVLSAICIWFPLRKSMPKIRILNLLIPKQICLKISKTISENIIARCSAKVIKFIPKKEIALFAICIWKKLQKI